MQNAKCYILDEPLTGWDADARKIAKDFLLETSQKNRSIILCEHQPDIQNIVTKKYKLENGLMNET